MSVVLGIETSCDETAVALVSDRREILAEALASQIDDHAPYGGVVPEVAARAHLVHLPGLVRRVLSAAQMRPHALSAIAATAGPGLIGGVIVGVMLAKAMAAATARPFIGVNHLEAHALTARLVDPALAFPYLLLLVSGGHCQLLLVRGVGAYTRLGTTIDDAVGEAFDKTAKLLGLGYPGGPAIEALAREGDPRAVDLPRPMLGRPGCDFSFSGLKTAVRQHVERLAVRGVLPRAAAADLCASFQAAVAAVLADRTRRAMANARDLVPRWDGTVVVAGGVAANQALGQALAEVISGEGGRLTVPPPRLCTDNGVMVAWAGVERLGLGLTDGLDLAPRPRWPLDPDAEARPGAGVKA